MNSSFLIPIFGAACILTGIHADNIVRPDSFRDNERTN